MEVDNVEEFENYVATAAFSGLPQRSQVFFNDQLQKVLGSLVRWRNLQQCLLTRPYDRRFASELAIPPGLSIQASPKFRN